MLSKLPPTASSLGAVLHAAALTISHAASYAYDTLPHAPAYRSIISPASPFLAAIGGFASLLILFLTTVHTGLVTLFKDKFSLCTPKGDEKLDAV